MDLKPCPFCGSPGIPTTANGETWISCTSCDASSRMCSRPERAVELWNARSSPWQPIETAPKDRTKVDIWVSGVDGRRPYRIPDAHRAGGVWFSKTEIIRNPAWVLAWMPAPAPPVARG